MKNFKILIEYNSESHCPFIAVAQDVYGSGKEIRGESAESIERAIKYLEIEIESQSK